MKNDMKRAFPVVDDNGRGLMCMDDGMALRDWFAGQALAGALANAQSQAMPVGGFQAWVEMVARDSYVYADAMMKARDAG